MKNFIVILVLLITGLTNSLNAQGSWSLQTNPTTKAGESMQFVSSTEGWISLTSNQLLHTTNAGGLWTTVTPNATEISSGAVDAPGSRISFINASTGWVLKTLADVNDNFFGAVLYKTSNGGASWNRTVLSNVVEDAGVQVQFVDANNGWVLIFNMNSGTPTFLKTTDGGTTWTPTNGGGIFYYVNATTGYAFSAGPNMPPPYYIMKTTDGGSNWTPQYVDNTVGELSAIQFTDVNNGWVVGKNGKIFHTTNGGTNWTQITNSGYNSNYHNKILSFINSTTGWIASRDNSNGNHFTLSTTDGGLTWSTQTVPFNYDIFSMDFWDASNGWAASDYGPIAKYDVFSGTYSNAILNGPWFVYSEPLDPYNDNLNYFVFDGNGNITAMNGFPAPITGNYNVNPDGSFSGDLNVQGEPPYHFSGQLTSQSEGTGSLAGITWKFHKITNPGALKDKIEGTITSGGTCGSKNITLNIDNNGQIISATGITAPVSGRVYADMGVFIGHMTSGEQSNGWHEFTISGYYNSSNNMLTGKLQMDMTSCNTGTSLTMFRSNNQPISTEWTLQTSGTTNSLKSAFFSDANNGYVVGGGQAGQSILKTTDGGNNWMTLNSFNSISLNSVFSTSANIIYCVGGDGYPNQTIIKTINGGSNWFGLSGGSVVELKSAYFVDSNIGYAVGGGNNTGQNIILKTTNGGTSWTIQSSPFSNLTFYSVFFTDVNTGYIVGESGMSGTILKTTNAGATWIQQPSGTGNHLYSVYFVDSNTGFIVGKNGTILKTTNGGTNWISKSSGTNAKLYSVNFLDANLGFAVGETGTILKTTNGGEEWILQASGTTTNLNSVYLKNNVGYAVGESGTILKNNNVSLNVKENIADKFISIYPNPSNGTFYFSLKEANSKVKAEIYTLSGQKVYEASNFEMQPQNEVNFAPQSKGIYLIKITDGVNSYSEKIMIK